MANLKNTTINDTGNIQLPGGTTAQRPSSPTNGMTRFNTTLNCLEIYYGGAWKLFALDPDVHFTCITWIMVLDNQSFHQLQAETKNTITQLFYQVVGHHANPISFGASDNRLPNIRIYSTAIYMPINFTTYDIVFFKSVNGVMIQVGQQKFSTRNI